MRTKDTSGVTGTSKLCSFRRATHQDLELQADRLRTRRKLCGEGTGADKYPNFSSFLLTNILLMLPTAPRQQEARRKEVCVRQKSTEGTEQAREGQRGGRQAGGHVDKSQHK